MGRTAFDYIADAFAILNVFQAGAPIGAQQAAQGLRLLNNMMGQWAQMPLTTPVRTREVVPMVSGKGGPSNPYTWGVGGDITSARPPNQQSLVGANLIMTSSTPPIEIPLAVFTDDGYEAVRIKDLSNLLPTGVYYQATVPLGTLILWPVPSTGVNLLALYHWQTLGPFADLSATFYDFPNGYDEAITYNLAQRLAGPNGRQMLPDDILIARQSFATIQRANLKLTDVRNDFASIGSNRPTYNILTGEGG